MSKKGRRKNQAQDLQPKVDHVGRQLGIPHEGLYRATRKFLQDMDRAEKEYREELEAQERKFGFAGTYRETPDVERYSLAVQIFAAITVEALISHYAVLRFGGAHHDDYFRWGEADRRLQEILRRAGIELPADAEIFAIVRGLMQSRHRIVHPFAAEYSGSDQATIQQPDRPGPDESAAGARRALVALDRFLELLRQADPAHDFFFQVF